MRLKFYAAIVIAVLFVIPVLAENGKDNEDLKQEVQKLREEVKTLNNSMPFRGDPTWGTGFMIGLGGLGVFGGGQSANLELGYSWKRWMVKLNAEEYIDTSRPNEDEFPFSLTLGLMGMTPLSVNLRGYVCPYLGVVKIPEKHDPHFIMKCVFGMEYFTNRHMGVFFEAGWSNTYTSKELYKQVNQGLVSSGVRFYF